MLPFILVLIHTLSTMQSNNKITPQRYRSTVFAYLCAYSKKENKPINKLPQPMLSELGASIAFKEARCSEVSLSIPGDLESAEVKERIEALERFLEENKGMAPDIGPVRKKNGKEDQCLNDERGYGFRKARPIEEGAQIGVSARAGWRF